MERRRLGDSEVEVSRIGLGCNNFGGAMWRALEVDDAAAVVDAALDAGINHFDTADVYGFGRSEEILGRALAGRRDRAVIATKFGMMPVEDGTPSGRPEVTRRCLEASLRRLETDYVDVLYYHVHDGATPIAETLGAMDELRIEGKVRAIACSNFSADQVQEAARDLAAPAFAAVQTQYSLVERDADRDLLPLALQLGVSFIPHTPLAGGLLTGKYQRGAPAPNGSRLSQAFTDTLNEAAFDCVDALSAYAAQCGHTLHELAVAALASMSSVASVIVGAMSADQARENARAAGWVLDAAQLAQLPRFDGRGVHW
jgi:aryl-alcohol dehydrogenase-like predicted oxidoreductase